MRIGSGEMHHGYDTRIAVRVEVAVGPRAERLAFDPEGQFLLSAAPSVRHVPVPSSNRTTGEDPGTYGGQSVTTGTGHERVWSYRRG